MAVRTKQIGEIFAKPECTQDCFITEDPIMKIVRLATRESVHYSPAMKKIAIDILVCLLERKFEDVKKHIVEQDAGFDFCALEDYLARFTK